jgi:hypothetical protein
MKKTEEQEMIRMMQDRTFVWCPYPNCGFDGTPDAVDDHRVAAHADMPQHGSNLNYRPVWGGNDDEGFSRDESDPEWIARQDPDRPGNPIL